jgi:ABC-type sugar transport system substrate-binding protein
MRTIAIAAAAAALLAAGAAPVAAAEKGKKPYDPNREICRSKPVLGSRLQRIRECHSAQQWLEMKQQEQWGLRRQQYNGAPGPKG